MRSRGVCRNREVLARAGEEPSGGTAMTRRRWRWVGLDGSLMLAGAVSGCSGGGDHDEGPHASGCVLVGEQEPNATRLTAQFLGDLLVDDCVAVAGRLFEPPAVGKDRVVLHERR